MYFAVGSSMLDWRKISVALLVGVFTGGIACAMALDMPNWIVSALVGAVLGLVVMLIFFGFAADRNHRFIRRLSFSLFIAGAAAAARGALGPSTIEFLAANGGELSTSVNFQLRPIGAESSMFVVVAIVAWVLAVFLATRLPVQDEPGRSGH